MGLFSRNKTNKSNHSGERSPSLQSDSLKSPRSAKLPSSSFGSLPTVAMPKPPDPNVDPAAYLRSIFAVRERTKFIKDKAERNKLNHFDVDMSKWGETAQYVVSIIKVQSLRLRCVEMANYYRRETSHRTTIPYHLMDDGNTLKPVDGLEWINCWPRGLHKLTIRNALEGLSICL